MHEMSIAESIIEIVSEELISYPHVKKVKSITFSASFVHAILPDSLRFHFDALKESYDLLKDASLIIHAAEIRARCNVCEFEFEVTSPIFVCPNCSGPAMIQSGSEMQIESIETED